MSTGYNPFNELAGRIPKFHPKQTEVRKSVLDGSWERDLHKNSQSASSGYPQDSEHHDPSDPHGRADRTVASESDYEHKSPDEVREQYRSFSKSLYKMSKNYRSGVNAALDWGKNRNLSSQQHAGQQEHPQEEDFPQQQSETQKPKSKGNNMKNQPTPKSRGGKTPIRQKPAGGPDASQPAPKKKPVLNNKKRK